METFETLVPTLTTARDKVYEVSSLFLAHPKSARALVAAWLHALTSTQDDRKRQSLLYVLNDVVVKSSRGPDSEYLQAFSEVMDGVIGALAAVRQELLLEELRKMALVWEDCRVFAAPYTLALKTRIMEAISSVLDEKSGAHAIQTYDLTRFLRKIEQEAVEHNTEKLLRKHYAEGDKEVRTALALVRDKCERQLADRTAAVMMLSRELRKQFEEYNRVDDQGVTRLSGRQHSTQLCALAVLAISDQARKTLFRECQLAALCFRCFSVQLLQ